MKPRETHDTDSFQPTSTMRWVSIDDHVEKGKMRNDDVAVVLEQRILVFWAVGEWGPPNYHARFYFNGETDGDECCTKFEKPPYIDFFFRVGSMNCPIFLDSCGYSPMFVASLMNLFQRWPPTVTVMDKMTIIVVMCYYCYSIYILN